MLWMVLAMDAAFAADVYELNPGDELVVHVWNEDTLQREVQVLPDGSISFPLVGNINTLGLSAAELETHITNKLKEYLADPVVNVTVTSVAGNVAYVVGQVNSPGPVVMKQTMTVMQALAMAGGLTAYASNNGIRIIRRPDSKGAGSAIKEVSLKVRYSDLQKGDDLSTNHVLSSGDVIVVP